MHPPFLLTGSTVLLATFLSVGAAGAQVVKPVAPAPRVHKLTIVNGALPEVTYFAPGGSPHQQALYRSLQFTENELALTEEVQRQRMEAVARQAAGLSPGCGTCPGYGYFGYDPTYSNLATDSALQLIRLREGLQTELVRAEKLGPPRERMPPPGPDEAVDKAMRAVHQGRAAAAPGRPVAQIPSFASMCALLAAQRRLGSAAPYASTTIAGRVIVLSAR